MNVTLTLPLEMVQYLLALVAERPLKEGMRVFAELQKQLPPAEGK